MPTKEYAKIKAKKYLEWAEKAEIKAKEIQDQWYKNYGQFDWTEPIKIGHHSQKRHEKMFEKKDNFFRKVIELEKKAKSYKEKANNLTIFANTNKGDAEKRKQEKREKMDQLVKVGDFINTIYGQKEIVKINKKTYTIKGNNCNFLVEKHLTWL